MVNKDSLESVASKIEKAAETEMFLSSQETRGPQWVLRGQSHLILYEFSKLTSWSSLPDQVHPLPPPLKEMLLGIESKWSRMETWRQMKTAQIKWEKVKAQISFIRLYYSLLYENRKRLRLRLEKLLSFLKVFRFAWKWAVAKGHSQIPDSFIRKKGIRGRTILLQTIKHARKKYP